jgi:hypothetical protein
MSMSQTLRCVGILLCLIHIHHHIKNYRVCIIDIKVFNLFHFAYMPLSSILVIVG